MCSVALLSHKSSSHVNFGDLPHLVAEVCMIGNGAVRILMECFLVYISVYGVCICDLLTWRLLRKVSLKMMTANFRKGIANTVGQTILNLFENLNAFETIYFNILDCFGFRIQIQRLIMNDPWTTSTDF